MDLDEIRAKSAEISVRITTKMGSGTRETEPLKFAKNIEEYIRTGNIPKTLIIKKHEV